MVGSIVRVATELMIMGLGVGDETAVQVLGTAPLLTMLLPLVLSHIGRVATSDSRVSLLISKLIFSLCYMYNLFSVSSMISIMNN